MGESKHGAPWELGPTGHVIYAAEVETGERTPYRPRVELARLSVDDPEVARTVVAAPLMLEALREAVADPPACFARPDKPAPRVESVRSEFQRALACECAVCARQRTFIAAIKAATGGAQ